MRARMLAAASAVALVLGAFEVYAADEKPARKSPVAQRAKNMSELYMESMPGTLPGGVPVVQQPVNPMGGGTPGADRPDAPAPAPDPTPAQPTPAPGPSPEPQPDPTPVGEAPPPPAPPAPPAPPSYGGCP